MKKIWIVALGIALLLALSLSVWAEAPQPKISYIESVHYEIREEYSETEDGYHLEIRPTDPDTVNEETLLETAEATQKIQEAGEIAGYDLIDVVMVRDSTGEVVEWHQPVRVAITYDKVSRLVDVFIQNDDGTWSEVEYLVGEDFVQLQLPHLSTVAFAYTELQPVPPDDTQNPTPTADPSTYSPQTGDNSRLWTALALAFALGSGLSLIAAKKAGE